MERYEVTAEMNLKNIIAESREVAQALNEFADNLEQIEKKYAEPTGHWITGRSTYYDVEMYRCSECKNWFAYKAEECPNCHVRMESDNCN